MKEKIKQYYEEHKEEIEKMAKRTIKIGGIAILAFGAYRYGAHIESLKWDYALKIIGTLDPNFKVADFFDKEKINQLFNAVTTE